MQILFENLCYFILISQLEVYLSLNHKKIMQIREKLLSEIIEKQNKIKIVDNG